MLPDRWQRWPPSSLGRWGFSPKALEHKPLPGQRGVPAKCRPAGPGHNASVDSSVPELGWGWGEAPSSAPSLALLLSISPSSPSLGPQFSQPLGMGDKHLISQLPRMRLKEAEHLLKATQLESSRAESHREAASELPSLGGAQTHSSAALTSAWGGGVEGAGHGAGDSPTMLLDLRLWEGHALPCLAAATPGPDPMPPACNRASGCPLPASGLADTQDAHQPGAGPVGSRHSLGVLGPICTWPKFTRSAEATEPWQGPLAQIRGCGGWGGRAGPQPTSGLGDLLSWSFVSHHTLPRGRGRLGIAGHLVPRQSHMGKASSHRP